MFAETTRMTRMISDLITRERKTPKNVAKGGGVGMTQASMPKVHTGGEGDRGGGCGRRGVHGVEVAGTVTSEEHHPGSGILDRETKQVKLNSHRIITCKLFNRDKIFDEVRRH
jgi:hypothetical protein